MKKLTSLLTLCLLITIAKSQTPSLNTLIRFVNTPIPDLTEEMISIKGWELTKSKLVDSVVSLQFDYRDETLIVKKVKDYKNELFFICNKQKYDILNKSLLQLQPKLINSTVNENGHVVKTYWGEKYGYTVSIAPKSLFSFQVYDKANALLREIWESQLTEKGSDKGTTGDTLGNNYENGGSGFGETPIALRKFNNLVVPKDDGKVSGKIAVRVKINKSGIVVDATAGVKGTTLNDRELWQKCKDAVMGARLTQSDSAPDIQIGVVVFNFREK